MRSVLQHLPTKQIEDSREKGQKSNFSLNRLLCYYCQLTERHPGNSMLEALQMQPRTYCDSAGLAKIVSFHSDSCADRSGQVTLWVIIGDWTKKSGFIVWICNGPAMGAKGRLFNQAVNPGYHLWFFSPLPSSLLSYEQCDWQAPTVSWNST